MLEVLLVIIEENLPLIAELNVDIWELKISTVLHVLEPKLIAPVAFD
jgi:hypothetical protein